MLKTYNEGAGVVLLIEFFDEDGQPVRPDDAWYVVEDPVTGTKVVDHTHVTLAAYPAGTSAVLQLPASAFVNPALPYESRKLTLQFVYDTPPKPGVVTHEWRIKRVTGLTLQTP